MAVQFRGEMIHSCVYKHGLGKESAIKWVFYFFCWIASDSAESCYFFVNKGAVCFLIIFYLYTPKHLCKLLIWW